MNCAIKKRLSRGIKNIKYFCTIALIFAALFNFNLFNFNMINPVWAEDASPSSGVDNNNALPDVTVTFVGVSGNSQVTSEYILGVVSTKVGEKLNRDTLQKDIEAIYEQGFFAFVDADLRDELAPDGSDGVSVTFSVQENPIIESISFTGNTIYKEEQLMKEVFSQTGTVFNRAFFKNDLDRIQEKYHKDGYVMVRVADVQVDGGNINVIISEPRVGDIIIQGNKKTRTKIIRREIKLKKGDIFNVNHFRHQLGKLQGLGYFEDVNVGFDANDGDANMVDLILTVKEKRTASIGVNVGYGTESGVSGGLTYSDTNLWGLGYNFEVGFDEGDESSYWITLSSLYMDKDTYAWRVGATYRTFDDRYYYRQGKRQFEYDEKSFAVFAGIGKKFRNEDWSWFFTLRREDTKYKNVHRAIPGYTDDLTPWEGVNQTVELQITWDKRDPYSPYPKGFVWDTTLEQALKVLGGDFDYLKYWTQVRYYAPLNKLFDGLFNIDATWTDENPLLLAARVRIGSASKTDIPSFAKYSLGGINTLRGYNSRYFEGRSVILGNFELRVPVNSNFSIVGFYDIGRADDDLKFSDMHDNYGIGVRVKTPFGNLRVDYAHGDEENRTYFGFGEMF